MKLRNIALVGLVSLTGLSLSSCDFFGEDGTVKDNFTEIDGSEFYQIYCNLNDNYRSTPVEKNYAKLTVNGSDGGEVLYNWHEGDGWYSQSESLLRFEDYRLTDIVEELDDLIQFYGESIQLYDDVTLSFKTYKSEDKYKLTLNGTYDEYGDIWDVDYNFVWNSHGDIISGKAKMFITIGDVTSELQNYVVSAKYADNPF